MAIFVANYPARPKTLPVFLLHPLRMKTKINSVLEKLNTLIQTIDTKYNSGVVEGFSDTYRPYFTE